MPLGSLRFALAALASAFAVTVDGKRVEGRATLAAGQALVVTKFCFDFNPECTDVCPLPGQDPGHVQLSVYSAKRVLGPSSEEEEEEIDVTRGKRGLAEFHVALLDDEYFSFPEVSQVWGEANCSDVIKAAKRSFPLKWDLMQSEGGAEVESALIEHLRPRWWYVALVSCSKSSVEVSYRIHLENLLQGGQVEFSMDQRGIFEFTVLFCMAFAGLVAIQAASLQRWRTISRRVTWHEVHPALLLLTASTLLALAGEVSTVVYFMYFRQGGEAPEHWAVLGRASIVAAKTAMSTMLMLLANGECVCTPNLRWADHQELIFGMVFYGCLQFPLELWGESESRNTTTEYIYDTRPGVVLVAFDVFWLYNYISRSMKTFRAETRIKARVFYKRYGPVFLIWFASLPLMALLARNLAAHVRLCIVTVVGGSVHVLMLSVLVYTFRPMVAQDLYDLKDTAYETAKDDEELMGILNATDQYEVDPF